MNAQLVRMELRRSRVVLFWLALAAVGYGVFIAAYYPTLVADTKLIETMLENFPKAMIAAFGMEGDLASQGTYFNVYLLSMLWPLLVAIAAILIPTRTFGADVERGFLEIPLATPISRSRYLLAAIACQIAVLAVLTLATILPIVGTLTIVGVTVDLSRWAVVGLLALAFACAMAAVTTLLAVLTLSRAVAGGIVAGLMVAMYLAQTVSRLAPEVGWIGNISAFHYFAPAPVINLGSLPADGLFVFCTTAVACWAGSVWAFRRRDLSR